MLLPFFGIHFLLVFDLPFIQPPPFLRLIPVEAEQTAYGFTFLLLRAELACTFLIHLSYFFGIGYFIKSLLKRSLCTFALDHNA
jgi:hypothetical protein